LQNFSILRATRAFSSGTILLVNRKELSAVVAECAEVTQRAAARTEQARANIEVSREGIEAARKRQEEAIARQEELQEAWAEMLAEERQRTEQIIAELKDQRDERRALMEALLRLMDRLPPPPPHLRSA
jgi:septal ring factor EnvC (AmiA/AmiB activator)